MCYLIVVILVKFMDGQIRGWLENYKSNAGQEQEVTPAEQRRFGLVTPDGILNALYNGPCPVGEMPQVESITPEGCVIYFDSHGRKTAGLEDLGYEETSDGRLKPRQLLGRRI